MTICYSFTYSFTHKCHLGLSCARQCALGPA